MPVEIFRHILEQTHREIPEGTSREIPAGVLNYHPETFLKGTKISSL